MDGENIVLCHGAALHCIGVDTVGHHRMVIPQAVFIVGLPIALTVGVQLPHPCDFRVTLGEVGLDIEAVLFLQLAKLRHQFIGAAGGKTGSEDGL